MCLNFQRAYSLSYQKENRKFQVLCYAGKIQCGLLLDCIGMEFSNGPEFRPPFEYWMSSVRYSDLYLKTGHLNTGKV